jgi:signal transduction histidine kinase
MNRVMNYIIIVSSLVVLCMISLQFLNFMELIGIYLGVATCLLVILTSVRSYKNGNSLALYTLLGFAAFLPVVVVFIFPFGNTDFRANETDIHYYAEAFRAVVFAVGVADRFKRVQQNALQLQLENNQLALAKEIQIQAERDRIRRDLHDSLGGQLSALSIGLGRLHVSHNFDSVVNLKSITDKAVVELRDSLWLLDKNQVSIEELEQRINNLFWQYRKSEVSTILIVNITKLEQQQLTSVVAGHLFRIIQESVQNAIKHSNATKVEVFLQKEAGRLVVKIEDNGCGFVSHSSLHEDHHYGLHNMRKRAEQIEGIFLISSSVGHGTCVSINLNLDKV